MGMKMKMTIREKVITAVNKYVRTHGYEKWMSGTEVRDYVNSCFSDGSPLTIRNFQPSDYCYNRYNDGLEDFAHKDRVLEYGYSDGRFRLLGENYSYNGDVWHFPSRREKDANPYIVGRWNDGKFELYSNKVVEEIKEEQLLLLQK